MVKKMIQAQEQQFSGSTNATTGSTLTAQFDANKKA
jgi:hypothetical protein